MQLDMGIGFMRMKSVAEVRVGDLGMIVADFGTLGHRILVPCCTWHGCRGQHRGEEQ